MTKELKIIKFKDGYYGAVKKSWFMGDAFLSIKESDFKPGTLMYLCYSICRGTLEEVNEAIRKYKKYQLMYEYEEIKEKMELDEEKLACMIALEFEKHGLNQNSEQLAKAICQTFSAPRFGLEEILDCLPKRINGKCACGDKYTCGCGIEQWNDAIDCCIAVLKEKMEK